MEKLFTRVDAARIINAVTVLESIPPDKNTPNGTSATNRRRTASPNNRSNSSTASSSVP